MLLAVGCQRGEEITSYSIPKEKRAAPPVAREEQLVGAIVPRGEQTWFFKLTGPPNAVLEQVEPFLRFVKSLKFNADGTPSWTLAKGWEQQPGADMRFATIRVPAPEKPMELTVIPLPSGEGDAAGYLLANVNRWRNQLQLEPFTAEQLAQESQTLKAEDATATVVMFRGTSSGSNRMGMGPFMSGARPTPPATQAVPAAGPENSAEPALFTSTVPEGWTPGQVGGMRKAAYTVQDGEKKVEITVIDLAGAAGELLPNVNRWRGQVKLPEMSQAELNKEVQTMPVGPVSGSYVELIGPQQTTLGVVAIHGGKAWFFKLTGDGTLAEREKSRFKQFVQSVKFRAQGADDGQ